MWVELFLCLFLAHLVADFLLQTSATCKSKSEKRCCSVHQYLHAVIVFVLTWLIAFDIHFWWLALMVGVSHLFIDIGKSYREDNIFWFVMDQSLHVLVLAGAAWLWCFRYDWSMPWGLDCWYVAAASAVLVCWKPANIFIKQMLQHFSVNMPEEKESGFNAGALIGTVERWLILIFVCLQRFDALGLLIAAKSIIRFGERETAKTEYVLAGTLLSILIAVLAGMGVMWFYRAR